VEHPCYQCGVQVEDGIAFCPKCNAPQIRVSLPEPAVPAAVAAEDGAISNVASAPADRIEWSQALPSVGWAVLLSGLIALGSLGLGMLVAGALAVVLYRRGHRGVNLSVWAGARLGVLTGSLGFGVILVGLAFAIFFLHAGAKIQDLMLAAMEQYMARHATPNSQQVIDLLKTSSGVIFALFLALLTCVAFASIGGALGALFFRRKPRL
jgi:hypothetical protein